MKNFKILIIENLINKVFFICLFDFDKLVILKKEVKISE